MVRLYFTPTRLPALAQLLGGTVGYAMWGVAATLFKQLRQIITLNAEAEGYGFGVSLGAGSATALAWFVPTFTGNFALGGLATVRNRGLAIRQTRRLLKEGSYSYTVLYDLFRPMKGLLQLLKPFLRQASRAHHELEAEAVDR
jgi:hypothetical protein